jgi:pimeloyl-ACP methyl ester carboxylesterase
MAPVPPIAYTGCMLVEPKSVFISAADGLRLHARLYGSPAAAGLPVVCLPGLARTEADFEALASAMANAPEAPRQVVALDYRGRGQSDYDRDVSHYSFQTELTDVVAVITALDCMPAVFVGTSRGGILTMLLAALRPSAIAGVVLNDIGPVLDPQGLMRIKGYVGKLPQPRDYQEGGEILRRLFSGQFPKLGQADWLAAAHRTFKEEKGRLVPTYDVRLAATLEGFDLERPLPPLWKEFDALARVPLLLIRGANSDLLTPETVAAMRARRRKMDVIEVHDQGHAPFLTEPDIIARIAEFVRRCERQNQGV